MAWPKEIFFCLGTEGAGIVGTDTEYCMDLVINLKKLFLGSFTGFTYTSYALMAQEKDLRLCCTVLVV